MREAYNLDRNGEAGMSQRGRQVSDHREGLKDHGIAAKPMMSYECVNRVPFYWRAPSGEPGRVTQIASPGANVAHRRGPLTCRTPATGFASCRDASRW